MTPVVELIDKMLVPPVIPEPETPIPVASVSHCACVKPETDGDALIEAMKSRNAVGITVPITGGAKDTAEIKLSLRGVAASLDFMHTYARKVDNY